jgi:hypothetical protein
MRIASVVIYPVFVVFLTTLATVAQGSLVKVDAWKSVTFCSMTFSVPKTLKDKEARGIDSCVAALSDDAISLSIDSGWYSGVSRYDDYLEFKEKKIVIDGKKGTLATYRDSTMAPEQSWVARLFVVIERSRARSPEVATNMYVVVGSKEELATAERIIRSIKFDK